MTTIMNIAAHGLNFDYGQEEAKPYLLFHSLFQSSKIEDNKNKNSDLDFSLELTLADPQETEVSTALTLGIPSSSTKKRKSLADSNLNPPPVIISSKRQTQQVVELLKVKSHSDEEGWKVRKRLTESDVCKKMSRLAVSKASVERHVLPHWDSETVEAMKSSKGASVKFYDCDLKTTHRMTFKYRKMTDNYVLNKNWGKFSKRKGLREDDDIGLYWDVVGSKFVFSVLRRAEPTGSSSTTTDL